MFKASYFVWRHLNSFVVIVASSYSTRSTVATAAAVAAVVTVVAAAMAYAVVIGITCIGAENSAISRYT